MSFSKTLSFGLSLACVLTLNLTSGAEVRGSESSRSLIPQKIDAKSVVPLQDAVRKDLALHTDLGVVEDSLKLNHLRLVLAQTPETRAEMESFLARQQTPGSPEYHQWLTPDQFGEKFGANSSDIDRVAKWLSARGFQVHAVNHGGRVIDFASDAKTLRTGLGVDLHYFQENGQRHFANTTAPRIPVALTTAVVGIHGLNNFSKQPQHSNTVELRKDADGKLVPVNPYKSGLSAVPDYYASATAQYEGAQDFYKIYNVNPLFNASTPILGTGRTIGVIEETDMSYGTINATTHQATGGDVATFRSTFVVPGTLGMYVYFGYGTDTCSDPGVTSTNEEEEATLDAEWANALSPNAKLIYMACDDTTDGGIDSSLAALVDNNLVDSMSESYGASEEYFQASDYAFYDAYYTQAAAQGQTITISTGDSGSDVYDQNATAATHGINVSGLSASPFITAAGGTDFQDYPDQLRGSTTSTIATYWNTSNGTGYLSAKGYVPETAWNSSCAGSIYAAYYQYKTGTNYAGTNLPNNCDGSGKAALKNVIGGSGGYSTHYAVPAYQSAVSGYTGTMRAQPDISFFASSGWWGHEVLFVFNGSLAGAGGTSFVAPQLTGIAGLIDQQNGGRQGLLNYALYALANTQFTGSSASSCYANGQTSNTGITTGLPASTCIFNDVTTGNNDVGCKSGALNCFVNTGHTAGILSTTSGTLTVAFPTGVAYDEATGLGSANVANLVTKWSQAFTDSISESVPSSASSSSSVVLSASVTGAVANGTPYQTPAGTVTFYAGGTKNLGSCTLASASCSITITGSAIGTPATYSITAVYSGGGDYAAKTSTGSSITIGVDLTFTSVTHNFGSIAAGTSTTGSSNYGVKLTNNANTSVSGSVVINGAGFSQNNNCGTTLAAGAYCEIVFTFSPAAAQSYTATWSLTGQPGNATFSPSNGGTLSGTGVAAGAVTLSTAKHNYGTQAVNTTSATFGAVLTNSTSSTVTIAVAAPTGNTSSFITVLNNCGTSLAAGQSCNLQYQFKPATTGSLSEFIGVTANGGGTPVTVYGSPYTGLTLVGTGQ